MLAMRTSTAIVFYCHISYEDFFLFILLVYCLLLLLLPAPPPHSQELWQKDSSSSRGNTPENGLRKDCWPAQSYLAVLHLARDFKGDSLGREQSEPFTMEATGWESPSAVTPSRLDKYKLYWTCLHPVSSHLGQHKQGDWTDLVVISPRRIVSVIYCQFYPNRFIKLICYSNSVIPYFFSPTVLFSKCQPLGIMRPVFGLL